MNTIYVSREGYKRLYESYLAVDAEIAEVHRKMGESAKMDNDLIENAEYMSLRVEAMYNLPNKKRDLYEKYKRAVIIEETEEYKNFDGKTVIRGSEIKILYGGEEEIYKILGNIEGNSEENVMSCEAPLAKLLLSKHVGDKTELNGEEIYIISVQRI